MISASKDVHKRTVIHRNVFEDRATKVRCDVLQKQFWPETTRFRFYLSEMRIDLQQMGKKGYISDEFGK